MHNYLTNCHTPTCFDTIMSSSGSLESTPCQVYASISNADVYLCNVARYWLQAPWGWQDSVETCRSV